MSSHLCVTGTVQPLHQQHPLSGATHRLVGARGQVLFLLRSRALTLDRFSGCLARVCGRRRGQVAGEAAPILEVAQAVTVDSLPVALGPFVAGASLRCDTLPLRLSVRLPGC